MDIIVCSDKSVKFFIKGLYKLILMNWCRRNHICCIPLAVTVFNLSVLIEWTTGKASRVLSSCHVFRGSNITI